MSTSPFGGARGGAAPAPAAAAPGRELARPAGGDVASYEDTWVTVFGFGPNDLPLVIREFSKAGDILQVGHAVVGWRGGGVAGQASHLGHRRAPVPAGLWASDSWRPRASCYSTGKHSAAARFRRSLCSLAAVWHVWRDIAGQLGAPAIPGAGVVYPARSLWGSRACRGRLGRASTPALRHSCWLS